MRESASSTVRELRSSPGKLSFEVDLNGLREQIWFRTDAPVTPTADAALATTLMLAMRSGGTLAIDEPIDRRLLRTQHEFQTIQRLWSRDWKPHPVQLSEVEVVAAARQSVGSLEGRAVAAFFSGGVDSWATVLNNPDITHLVFVRGADIRIDDHELGDHVETRLRAVASELGLSLYVIETNVRELSDRLFPWDAYYGCALAACALTLAPAVERVLIAGSADYETKPNRGTDPLVDHLWGTECLEVAHDGGRFSRVERLEHIAGHPAVQRSLRVCWENRDGAYNCGRCRKCLMTMVPLEALGVRDRFATFPPRLDLDAVRDVEIVQPESLTMWQDVLDLIEECGRPDLRPSVAQAVANGKRRLGLPPSWRERGDDHSSNDDIAAQLDTVLSSRSWRLTRPLRAAASRLRR